MKIRMLSKATGNINEMEISVDPEKLKEWDMMPFEKRPYIQDFFPELTPDEREFLLSGITPQEWNDMFGEED